jgi:CspA family cold shock protein
MPKGKVKWFNDLKGYGFITMEDGYHDVYIHHSEIRIKGYKTLKVGENVEFEMSTGPDGPRAKNVIILN